MLQILINLRCPPKALNWRRIDKIMWITYPLDILHLFPSFFKEHCKNKYHKAQQQTIKVLSKLLREQLPEQILGR